jgi:type IV pilus assembly protein PilX
MQPRMATRPARPRAARQLGLKQRARGMVLLVVLVVLALLLLAGAGALRAVDSGNVIAGNFSFQQAAMQSADRALTDALNTAAGAVISGGGNTNVPNRYFSTRQGTVDARGFPTSITWDNVACVDPAGTVIGNCATDDGNYRIQYVIERLCNSNPTLTDITDIRAKCEHEASAGVVSAFNIQLRYRVIMRVRGPRGTEQWFEAMISGPASS